MQERGTFLLCPRKLFPNYVDPNESISFFHLTIFLSAFCSSATFVWIGFCTLLTNYNVKKYNHIELRKQNVYSIFTTVWTELQTFISKYFFGGVIVKASDFHHRASLRSRDIHVKESVNALPKVVGFLLVLRFLPTGNVDRVGWD